MDEQEEAQEPPKEIRRFEAEQRNAAVAAKLLKSKSNYDPLWNSGPRPPLIWRVGAGILGAFFLFFGGCFFLFGLEEQSVALFAVAALFALASARPFWNAFKPRKVDSDAHQDSAGG